MQLDRAVDAPRAQGGTAVHYRPPRKTDGTRIWALIRSIAALDDNSLYCNLLQCSHFAGTCALAEIDGRAVGWIRSEEHTSELQSLMRISYAVFCLKKKKQHIHTPTLLSQPHPTTHQQH